MELNYPPFLLPLALAFWGWQCQMLPALAAILALVTLSRYSPWRWHMGIAEFHRVGDLTAALLAFAAIYCYSTDGDAEPVYEILRWLPVLTCPLLFGQIYSTGQLLPLSAMFYSMRRYPLPNRVDIRLPYAFLCLLAAGSGKYWEQNYYPGVTALTLLTLWSSRPRRQAKGVWLLGFALAVVLGYGIQAGLVRLQEVFEEWALDWFSAWEPDPFTARTAIGDRGKLKLSTRVLLKVTASQPLKPPLLLKEAAYDHYSGQHWSAVNALFHAYPPPNEDGPYQITVLHLLDRHSVLLALPAGVRGLEGPQQHDLLRNPLGTVKWLDAPPVVRYRVAYDPSKPESAEPTVSDTQLPPATLAMLTPLAQELGLRSLQPKQAVAAIAGLFAARYGYSLDLGHYRNGEEALRDFLYRRRAGHCEYFATATALLLRAAAIPARYVVGYSVQEYDPAGKAYLVRQRHAHAWAEAYVDGAWHSVDNTPARWAEEEAKADPWWQAIVDIYADWATAVKLWQWERSQHPRQDWPWWAWLVLPLSAWLGLRLYRSRQRVASTQPLAPQAYAPGRLNDHEYSLLEQRLLALGHPPRHPGETPLRWLRRLGLPTSEGEVLAFYRRRYREFDRAG